MNARHVIATVIAVSALLAGSATLTNSASDVQPRHVVAAQGDSWSSVATFCNTTASALRSANNLGSSATLRTGAVLHCPVVTTPPTTTTQAPTTTTQAPTTTTTQAPTTSTSTSAPTPTTSSSTSTTEPPADQFVETFDGNTGLDRFAYGVHHRDDLAWADTWSADHDMNCGSPATQRTVSRFNPAESFYLCADHLMTSVGDASSYSVAWFEPKQAFARGAVTKVSWDVNVTDLGARQWWEVMIVPAAYESGISDCPHCAVHWSLSPSPSNLPPYPDRTSVIGLGPLGGDGNFVPDDEWENIFGHCHIPDCIDVEGAGSKQLRRTFWMRDNLNGTLTFNYFGSEYTRPGAFPDEFRVVFKDHNYTPSKDGTPVGFTWHWDNIVIR